MRAIKNAAALAALALILAGCSAAAATDTSVEPIDASNISCDAIAAELETAQATLDSAEIRLHGTKTALNRVEGTPGESAAKDDVDTAQADVDTAEASVDALTARASECEQPDASDASCPEPFIQVTLDRDAAGGKVEPRFDEAMTAVIAQNLDAEAHKAETTRVMLSLAGTSAQTLAVWAHASGLYEDPNAWTPLVTEDGTCLSDEGQALYYRYEGSLKAQGVTVENGEVPANWVNSGIIAGTYSVAENAGITGDMRAVVVTMPDGTVVIYMVRCGNIPWDEPPVIVPKNGALDPYPRGNAPDGGGPNANPGPDVYIPPDDMEQPGSTPRENPATPEPTVPPAPPETPAPTPDPAPAPSPEPSAPPSTAPETGCVPIPGIEDCS